MTTLPEISLALLKELIAIPSFSKEEQGTASALERFFKRHNVPTNRKGNNVWAVNRHFDPAKPSVLLNSHHDTVKPNPQYTRNPFLPIEEDGRLYGLGSNDAGAPLVTLIAAFLHYYEHEALTHNLVLAATAEEEISGTGGIESLWGDLPVITFAIVGEPTQCKMAVAEKGLMVLDCTAHGVAGHAAREEGINAIYQALDDIQWIRTYAFPKASSTLGPVKMSVTIVQAGKQHNVVPAECAFTIDVRLTDAYTAEEVLATIKENISADVHPRSMRLKPSGIAPNHPLVVAAAELAIECYGSPTTSDQALIPVPSVKIGPGDSARSHSADEYVFVHELEQGIATYTALLNKIIL